MNQPEQDVLGADVVVVQKACFFLRKHDDPAGPIGEPFKHFVTCLPDGDTWSECTHDLPNRLVGNEGERCLCHKWSATLSPG
ncbi:unannotated protein [freshwater metagenome]|uniref:Unannotated protein n=1 Tax=freshwater metagenome TaxID=449393 RepID=A0A6J7JD55_9ZZZZ